MSIPSKVTAFSGQSPHNPNGSEDLLLTKLKEDGENSNQMLNFVIQHLDKQQLAQQNHMEAVVADCCHTILTAMRPRVENTLDTPHDQGIEHNTSLKEEIRALSHDIKELSRALNTLIIQSPGDKQDKSVPDILLQVKQDMRNLVRGMGDLQKSIRRSDRAGSTVVENTGHEPTQQNHASLRQIQRSESRVVHEFKDSREPMAKGDSTYGNSKNFPKLSAYPVFKGGREEDWQVFIEKIDILQSSYNLPDSEIVSKLPNLLIEVAYVWFRVTYPTHKKASWETWKALIKTQYGNAAWRQKQMELLEFDKFTYNIKDVLSFLLNMHTRINAVYPGMSFEDLKAHIRMRLPSELHATINSAGMMDVDISSFLSTCEEIITSSLTWKEIHKMEESLSHNLHDYDGNISS